MRFEQSKSGWQLVHHSGKVIATLTSEVEVLALRSFCERFLKDPSRLPELFTFERHGERFTVTPLGAEGEKLAMIVTGGGMSTTISTQFVLAGESPAN